MAKFFLGLLLLACEINDKLSLTRFCLSEYPYFHGRILVYLYSSIEPKVFGTTESAMFRLIPKFGVRRLNVTATALQRPRISISVVNSSRRWCTTAVSSPGTVQSPPEHKAVAYWLLGMGGLVAGMVTIGGITRLTRSGLSMTDWKLQGSLPPMTKEDWEKEFERYKQFPEWQQRQRMTIEEFKFIYFWEYGHRMFGRFLGVAFTVPLVYFSACGMIPRTLYPRLGLLFGLGGTQGLVGW